MGKKYTAGRVLLWAISGYHVLVGLMMLLSGELAIKAAKVFGGMTLQGGPEQGAIGEMFACYLIAFGLLMGAAAWNPVKNRAAITIGGVLFALRILQRLFFSASAMSVFSIPPGKYWAVTAVIFLLGAGLVAFRWKIHRDCLAE